MDILVSIQPYWVFLIIAKTMGWSVQQRKTVEVRKNYPKAESWNKVAKIYCSKDKRSFSKIPKEYQPLMERFLGKVIGEFICDKITYLGNISTDPWCCLLGNIHEAYKQLVTEGACLTEEELLKYGGKYAWHISDLVIYDQPRGLSEFWQVGDCNEEYCIACPHHETPVDEGPCKSCDGNRKYLCRPPQSWCYVQGV